MEGNYFLIKLHGSCNWTSFDGSEMMVIGRGKKIQTEPLLKRYFDIFDYVLSRGLHRLFIIGYGFGDIYINETISKYVIKNELKIYILLPESPKKLKEKLCEGPEKSKYTINIWRGISGYSQCVEEVLINKILRIRQRKDIFTMLSLVGKDTYRSIIQISSIPFSSFIFIISGNVLTMLYYQTFLFPFSILINFYFPSSNT